MTRLQMLAIPPTGGAPPAGRLSSRTCMLAGRAVRALAIVGSLAAGFAEGAEGHLDPTFGSGGRMSFDPGRVSLGVYDDPNSVIQQMDGRIVIAGQSLGRLLLARLEPDGSLDVSFSDDGIVTGGNGRSANIVIQQRDGKLVAAGGDTFSGPLVLWRFNSNGRLDGGFGDRGSVVLHAVGSARGLVQQADEKLVVVGGSRLARFHPDGSLDPTFGENGIVIVRFPSPTFANVLLQQADGKLVVIGSQNLSDFGSPDSGVALARVTADGDFDQAFGEGGIVEIPLRSLMTEGSAQYTDDLSAALQDDGKIVIAGTAAVGGRLRGFILRLQANGDPDHNFGSEGIVFVSPAFQHGVTIAADGKIITATTVCSGSDYRVCDMALMQRNADGSVDASFGTPIADFGLEREIRFSQSRAMTRQADGKLVVVGRSRASADDSSSLAIARFSSDATGFAGLIGLTSAACQCPDNGGPAEFVVRRTGGSTGAVAVDVATADGSAVAGSDYVAQRRRLEWPDGDQSTRKIVLQLIDNSKSAPEAFTLRLSNPTGGAILTTSIATVLITDGAPPVIQLLGDPTYFINQGEPYVEFGATATDDVDGDISAAIVIDSSEVNTFVRGSYTVTYDVKDSSGNAAETVTRTVHVQPGPGVLSVVQSSVAVAEQGQEAVVTVSRTGGYSGSVSVGFQTVAGGPTPATAGQDYTEVTNRLTWGHGDVSKKTIRVPIRNDDSPEENETFGVRLFDPSGATLGSNATATVTIVDDDTPGGGGTGGTLVLAGPAVPVAEGGSVVLAVSRSDSSAGAVSVEFATSAGTATAGSDFESASGTLTWADRDSTNKYIEILTTDDATDESDETFSVTLSNPSGGATLGSNTTTTITITDDDTPGGGGGSTLGLSRTAARIDEADGSIVLTVARNGAAVGTVSVDYSTSSGTATEGSDFVPATGMLHWADGDSSNKSVRVDVIDDGQNEEDETFALTLSNPSGTILGSESTATVTIMDDDPLARDGDSGSGGGGTSDRLFLSALLLIGLARLWRSSSSASRWWSLARRPDDGSGHGFLPDRDYNGESEELLCALAR